MAKKQALGSGLGELLGEVQDAYEKNLGEYAESVVMLSVDVIKPNPFQPRKNFDESALNDLAESIVEHGLLQPILVYDDDGEYFLVAGERRLRASKIAGKSTIKAVVANEYIDRGRLRELAIIENIQRENLNPLDLAQSYQELIEEYGITHEMLATKLKKSRTQITNTMRILDLCKYVQDLIVQNKITQGHAKVMVGLQESEQKMLADSIVGQKLSVRETEQLVKDLKNIDYDKKRKATTRIRNNDVASGVIGELLTILASFDLQAKVSQNKIIIQIQKEALVQLIKKLKS